MVTAAITALQDKKGTDIVLMDVGSLGSSVTDYYLLCSGNSDRQNQALADHVREELIKLGDRPLAVEGMRLGEWILMDYVNLIVHIFLPRVRSFYNLEELWGDAPQQRF